MRHHKHNRNRPVQPQRGPSVPYAAPRTEPEGPAWIPPTSIADARARRQVVTDRLLNIEMKLASRNVLDSQGLRMLGREYWAHRDMLVRKKMHVVREIQRLKAFITECQSSQAAVTAGVPQDDDDALFRRLWDLLQKLKKEDVEFYDEELAVLDVLGKRVGKR